MFAAAAAAAILLSSAVASASPVDRAGGTSIPSIKGLLDKNNLPTTGQDWISLDGDKSGSGLEYQPNDFDDEDPETARHLRAIRDRALLSFGSGHYSKQFIDGSETYYDEYSQAWRLLGFYVDCNSPYEHQGDCGGGGGEDDQDRQQNDIQYDANGKVIKNCVRYLLWAAYIDLDYKGGGIGEYQFFNHNTSKWDKSSCTHQYSGRCAKYDCHLHDSNFKLLGLFKEANYHSWMEQLYKHEGACVWSENEYELMQYNREAWPCGCTKSSKTDMKGNYIYYDMKPLPEGRMTFGLYKDASCSTEHSGNTEFGFYDPVKVVEHEFYAKYGYNYTNANDQGEEHGTIATLADDLKSWNDAFDVFKKCQPCKAYDLNWKSNNQYHDSDDGTAFACHDDAGYNSVNQCMKFRTKTDMYQADFGDVALASAQGTITEIDLLGSAFGDGGFGRRGGFQRAFNYKTGKLGISVKAITWFVVSLISFIAAFIGFVFLRKVEKRQQKSSARVPLVPK